MEKYKPDWKEARQRLTAWWEGKKTDRVPASVTGPRRNPPDSRAEDLSLPQKFTDPDTVFRNLDIRLANTVWGGEALPHHFVYLGALFSVLFLGVEPRFHERGAWYKSPYSGWKDACLVNFDRDNHWWKLYRSMVQRSAERSEGAYLTTVVGLEATLDVCAELFGSAETLFAIMDIPEEVKALRDRIIGWGKQMYDELSAVVSQYQEGSIDWMRLWAPGRVRTIQCDMSVTFSPEIFRDFVVDELQSFFRHVDYGIYHMDGDEQKKHLDLLLAIESLDLIQFSPTPNQNSEFPSGDPMLHLDLFKKILEGGKKVRIGCPVERIKPLLNALPRKGIYLFCNGCRDEQEVSSVLKTLDSIGT